MFRLVNFIDSPSTPNIYLYSKRDSVGEQYAGYYDFVTDGPIWVDGTVKKGLYFSSESRWDDQPYVTANSVPDLGSGYTIEGYVRPDTGGIFLSRGLPYLSVTAGGPAHFSFTNSAGSQVIIGGGYATKDQWSHVVGTHIGTQASLYVNGILVATSSDPSAYVSLSNWIIGKHAGSSGHTINRGGVDEIRIYTAPYAPEELYVVNKA